MNYITYIVPTFNQSGTILQTLESIKAITLPGDQIIVYNACSTDDTLRVISTFNPACRLDIITEADDGFYDAARKAINKAINPIIAFQSSDDFYTCTLSSIIDIRSIFSDTSISLVYGDYLVYENELPLYKVTYNQRSDPFSLCPIFPQSSTFISRAAAIQSIPFLRKEYDFISDLVISLVASTLGQNIYLSQTLSVVRSHATNRTKIAPVNPGKQLINFYNELSSTHMICDSQPIAISKRSLASAYLLAAKYSNPYHTPKLFIGYISAALYCCPRILSHWLFSTVVAQLLHPEILKRIRSLIKKHKR